MYILKCSTSHICARILSIRMTATQSKNKVVVSNHQPIFEQYDSKCNNDSHVQKKHYTSSKGSDFELHTPISQDKKKGHFDHIIVKV